MLSKSLAQRWAYPSHHLSKTATPLGGLSMEEEAGLSWEGAAETFGGLRHPGVEVDQGVGLCCIQGAMTSQRCVVTTRDLRGLFTFLVCLR